jgi:NitT/TauT family transport system substrate-binding protein
MNRRQFLQLSVAALPALGLVGCSKSQPLKTGIHPWIGYESLYLADEFGWLPQTVELVKGQAASDSMTGLLAGELDAAALTLDEALRVFSSFASGGGDQCVGGCRCTYGQTLDYQPGRAQGAGSCG